MNVFELIFFLLPAGSAYWLVAAHSSSSTLERFIAGVVIAALSYACIFRSLTLPALDPDRRREQHLRPLHPLLFWTPIAHPLLALLLIPLLTHSAISPDYSIWRWIAPAACAWLALALVNECVNLFVSKLSR